MGRRKKGRGPCKSQSYKVLKLIFYSVVLLSQQKLRFAIRQKIFCKNTVYYSKSIVPGGLLVQS